MSEINQDVVKTYAKAERIIAVALSECSHPTLLPCDHEGNATAIIARLAHAGILLQSGEECQRCDDIEQKAIALLRDLETSMEPNSPVRLLNPRFEDLGKAIGVSIEELRAATDTCECHERDGSYVCESCYAKGLRGHMQKGGEQ